MRKSGRGSAIRRIFRTFFTKYGKLLIPACAGALYIDAVKTNTFSLFMQEEKEEKQIIPSIDITKDKSLPERIGAVRKIRDEVMESLDWDLKKKTRILFEYTPSLQPQHVGTVNGLHGAIIGIPFAFTVKNTQEIKEKEFTLDRRGQTVDWESREGKAIADSYVMSENAQKFAIAREVLYCNCNWKHHFIGALRVFVFGSALAIHFAVRTFIMLHPLERTVYGIGLVIYVLGTYYGVLDWYNRKLDNYVDQTAVNMGDDYLKGGLEFYSKILQLNIATQKLLKGRKYFHPNGNVFHLPFRSPEVPLTVRKQSLQGKMAQKVLLE